MPHIKMIDYSEATGRLKEIYDSIIKKRGKLADVHKIQSLHPESILAHIGLYTEIMFSDSPVTREQREMIAVVVSSANRCPYCVNHHAHALNSMWNNDGKVKSLSEDFKNSGLNAQDLLLSSYAVKLTIGSDISHKETIEQMKAVGLSDRAILDATLVIAYFNFVNRMVLGLGVDLEEDGGTGYNY